MTADSRTEEAQADSPATSPDVRDRRFLLVAPSGVSALVSSWGAGLVALHAPDRAGRFDDIVLGFDTAAEYAANAHFYFGCTVGRVANRIREARFELDGTSFELAANDGPNHLHGGAARSFDRVEWEAETVESPDGPRVVFRYTSPHLEEGYPGEVAVTVTYTMTARDELRIDYEARTDRTTPVSLTNHTYWNLAGAGRGDVLGHELELAADRYTPTDGELIPTGAIKSVDGTALDFRAPRTIGSRIDALGPAGGGGYDHNYVLSERGPEPTFAARLRDPASGRVMEVGTTQPCLQFYSGGFMTPTRGKLGRHYDWRTGVCLEAQGYPDAVNNPAFASILLAPGEVYRAVTILRVMTDQSPVGDSGS